MFFSDVDLLYIFLACISYKVQSIINLLRKPIFTKFRWLNLIPSLTINVSSFGNSFFPFCVANLVPNWHSPFGRV